MAAVTHFRDVEERWSFDLPELPDVVLQKGFKVKVDRSHVPQARPGWLVRWIRKIFHISPAPSTDPVECRVVKWYYRVGATEADSRLEVTLEEIKPPWFAQLNPDSQALSVVVPATVTMVLGVAVVLLIWLYPAPLEFWAFVGKNMRGLIGWLLFLTSVVLAVAIHNALSADRETWMGMYLNFLLPALGLVAVVYWLEVSQPPQPFTGAPDEYIAYLDYLVSKGRTVWPMLLSAIPCVVFLFKVLGLKGLSELFEGLGKALKP